MSLQPLYFSGASQLRERQFIQPHLGNSKGSLANQLATDTTTLGATTSRVGIITQAPATGDLDAILLRVHTITLAGTQDLRVRVEGVSSDGVPDGVVVATATPVTEAVATTGAFVAEFPVPPALIGGQFISIVIERAGTCEFQLSLSGTTSANAAIIGDPSKTNFPNVATYSSSTWTRSSSGTTPILPFHWVRIASRWRNCGFIFPLKAEPMQVTIPASTEAGIAITPVHDIALAGLRVWMDIGGASPSGSGYFRLYDSDGTSVLRSVNFYETFRSNAFGGVVTIRWGSVRLRKGTRYYIRITGPTDWTIAAVASGNETSAQGDLRQGVFGHDVYLTSRVTAGSGAWASFDNTNAVMPFCGFVNAGNYQ